MPQPQPGAPNRAASLSMAQQVENPPAMQETQEVESLGQEDPLGKEMALPGKFLSIFSKKKSQYFFSVKRFSILAWKIPWIEEPGGLQSVGSQESDTSGHTHRSLSKPLWSQHPIFLKLY